MTAHLGLAPYWLDVQTQLLLLAPSPVPHTCAVCVAGADT